MNQFPSKNYFTLPNEIFSLGLSAGEIAVYAYLRCLENRSTYQEDNCRSKNEFIEKAVNCYADMLAAGESTMLPRAVQSAIDSRLKLFEDRIASLLYKQAVEMDMAMSILLQSLNVSEDVLRQERAKSIAAVKRTNGQLRLEQKLRELESEAWQG